MKCTNSSGGRKERKQPRQYEIHAMLLRALMITTFTECVLYSYIFTVKSRWHNIHSTSRRELRHVLLSERRTSTHEPPHSLQTIFDQMNRIHDISTTGYKQKAIRSQRKRRCRQPPVPESTSSHIFRDKIICTCAIQLATQVSSRTHVHALFSLPTCPPTNPWT